MGAKGCLDIKAPLWEYDLGEGLPQLALASCGSDNSVAEVLKAPFYFWAVGGPINEASTLVFESHNWPSENEARRAAGKYIHALMLTFARLYLAVDFGHRTGPPGFSSDGLRARLAEALGRPVHDNSFGLEVYESEPQPAFLLHRALGSRPTVLLATTPQALFERTFSLAVQNARDPSPAEQLALDLFHAALFQHSADARFVLLVMAVEALLEPAPRSPAAQALVERFLETINAASEIPRDERSSLCGSARWLMSDSISRTGRKLSEKRLGDREYAGMKAAAFFTHCYDMRSRLVHSNPPVPSRDEIRTTLGTLQLFVSDLLTSEIPQSGGVASAPIVESKPPSTGSGV